MNPRDEVCGLSSRGLEPARLSSARACLLLAALCSACHFDGREPGALGSYFTAQAGDARAPADRDLLDSAVDAPATPDAARFADASGTAADAAASPLDGTAADAEVPGTVTFHQYIRPLTEARCVGCHRAGGRAPFPLDTWDAVEPMKDHVVRAVLQRSMPPQARADDTSCTKLRHDQRLTEPQIALFSAWAAAGYWVGDARDFVPLAEERPRELAAPDLIIEPIERQQLRRQENYYACLQTNAAIREDTWVTAMELVPEQRQYVRRVITSMGSTCSSLATGGSPIFSYVAGATALAFEAGQALLIPAGARIVMQVNYDTSSAPDDFTPVSDLSALRLWTLPAGRKPQYQVQRGTYQDLSISIPVDAVDQQEQLTHEIGDEFLRPGAEIIGVTPHMHYLGQRFEHTLLAANGRRTCLLDVPDWDSEWPVDYMYDPAAYVPVSEGSRIEQSCVYSNRLQDQGIGLDGQPFTPRPTSFGEDMNQEQCLSYVWYRLPVTP